MKKLLVYFFLIMCLGSCKKAIQKIKEDMVVSAMTDGQWVITSFVYNGNDITSGFSTYKFQYFKNKTVDAINNGTVEKKGTWDGDVNSMTTWANFTNAVSPLLLINGTWHITDNSWTYVVASQMTGSETKNMRLEKK